MAMVNTCSQEWRIPSNFSFSIEFFGLKNRRLKNNLRAPSNGGFHPNCHFPLSLEKASLFCPKRLEKRLPGWYSDRRDSQGSQPRPQVSFIRFGLNMFPFLALF